MVKKEYYSINKVQGLILDLVKQMVRDEWKPDYIVGINRGGLVPAVMLSHYLSVPLEVLNIKLRDHATVPESNVLMPLDAFEGKQILVIDDINDTGATFNYLMDDWTTTLSPYYKVDEDPLSWADNVKFAVLTENLASEFHGVNYFVEEINKAENDVWIVFPWEQWWNMNESI